MKLPIEEISDILLSFWGRFLAFAVAIVIPYLATAIISKSLAMVVVLFIAGFVTVWSGLLLAILLFLFVIWIHREPPIWFLLVPFILTSVEVFRCFWLLMDFGRKFSH